jgi:predicted HicB family RNase H-like nuclease
MGPKMKAWDGIEKPAKPEKDKFVLRLPDGMREQIKESAKLNERSMNSEIIYRLRETLKSENDA